jgi:hypothetical protein
LNLSERVLCVLLRLCDQKNADDDCAEFSECGLICESDESADEPSELRSSDDDDSDCDDFYGMIFSVP